MKSARERCGYNSVECWKWPSRRQTVPNTSEKLWIDLEGSGSWIWYCLPLPSSRSRLPRNCSSNFRRELLSAGCATLSAECLGSLVLARIAHVFLDLARQDLGDADRVGDGISGSFLALRSLGHSLISRSLPLSI